MGEEKRRLVVNNQGMLVGWGIPRPDFIRGLAPGEYEVALTPVEPPVAWMSACYGTWFASIRGHKVFIVELSGRFLVVGESNHTFDEGWRWQGQVSADSARTTHATLAGAKAAAEQGWGE